MVEKETHKLFTVYEAAKMLNKSVPSTYQGIKKGHIKTIKVFRGLRKVTMISAKEIERINQQDGTVVTE